MRNNRKSESPKRNITSQHKAGTGVVRIIGGQHKGRKLAVINAEGLRPTTDRIKETVFNWLMPYLQDSRCLDCFAGSGSLGFEAWSRGAKSVTLIEKNASAYQQLVKNKHLLNAETITPKHDDALQYLTQQTQQPYDVVFLDPPFFKDLLASVIAHLDSGWLASNALIYVETEREFQLTDIPSHWRLLKEKVAGQVRFALYQNNEPLDSN